MGERKKKREVTKKKKPEKTYNFEKVHSRPDVHEELVEGRIVPVVERAGAGTRGDVAAADRGGRRIFAIRFLLLPKEATAAAAALLLLLPAQNGNVAHARGHLVPKSGSLAAQEGQREPDARAVVEAVAAERLLLGFRLLRRRRGSRRLRLSLALFFFSFSFFRTASRESLPQRRGEAGVPGAWSPRGRGGEGGGER